MRLPKLQECLNGLRRPRKASLMTQRRPF